MHAIFGRQTFSQKDIETFNNWKNQIREAWNSRQETTASQETQTTQSTQSAATPASTSTPITVAPPSAETVITSTVSTATQTLNNVDETASQAATATQDRLDLPASQAEKVTKAITEAVSNAVSALFAEEPTQNAAVPPEPAATDTPPESPDFARRAAIATIARAAQDSLIEKMSDSPFTPLTSSIDRAAASYGSGQGVGADDTRVNVEA